MARTLTFDLGGTAFQAEPVKLDRKKVYGWTETAATDGAGKPCRTAWLDPDGSLVVPASGTANATLAADGTWLDAGALQYVDEAGNELPAVPSSFDAPIALGDEVDEEAFLDHVWSAVYQLSNPDLAAAVGERIFRFPFNYRAGPAPREACLLASGGVAWLFAGDPVAREFVGLEQAGELEEEPEEASGEEEELDFGMM